jgi:hypothetical protein
MRMKKGRPKTANSVHIDESPTWPRDSLRIPKDLDRKSADHLICFLACPLNPVEVADDLMQFIQSICDEIGKDVGANIQCVRSDKIAAPGTIHADIWKHLELADALVFDVTGGNGNVLLELGVAATCRSQHNIVILRKEDDLDGENRFLFDIAPNRHFLYRPGLTRALEFRSSLKETLIHALTPAPYRAEPERKTRFPLKIDIKEEGDSPDLLSPPMLHRRLVDDGLEFGSLYFFRNSWVTVGNEDHSLVRLKARMRFSERAPNVGPGDGWMGVALRSQHFFANYGHLAYVRPDGMVIRTEPLSESTYEDVQIGYIKGYDPSKFVPFDLEFTSSTLKISIGSVKQFVNLRKAKHVRHAGKIRFQTYRCRAILKDLEIEIDG